MPSYKLCYFNTKGLGEMSRLMFAEAGVPFEDVRYTVEEWVDQKPKMLFHTMPVLFVDNEQIAHSRAIVRYLARQFKLEGGDALTAAKVDMWIETLIEAIFTLPINEKDEKKKIELADIAFKDHIMPKFSKLEELIISNKGPYAFGNKITALDITVYCMLNTLHEKSGIDVSETYPNIKAMMAAVKARPNIAEWMKVSPEMKPEPESCVSSQKAD